MAKRQEFLIFLFLLLSISSWSQDGRWIISPNTELSNRGIEVVCDYKDGKILVLKSESQPNKTSLKRLQLFDVSTQTLLPVFPLDWNLEEGIACFGNSTQELFFQSNINDHGIEVKNYRLCSWDSSFTMQSLGKPIVMDGNEGDFSYDNLNPCYNFAEKLLVFSSNRPGGKGGYDLYGCYRLGNEWGPVFNLGGNVNTSDNELSPTWNSDELYFTRLSMNDLSTHLMKCSRGLQFANVEELKAPFNHQHQDWRIVFINQAEAFISTEGNTSILTAKRTFPSKEYHFRIISKGKSLPNLSIRVSEISTGETQELITNAEGVTEILHFSAETKYRVSIDEKMWQNLQAQGMKKCSAELYDEYNNIVRVFTFNANGKFEFELLDFIYTNLVLQEEDDESTLNGVKASSANGKAADMIFYYKSGAFKLSNEYKGQLKEITKNKNLVVEVRGFTSADGTIELNKKLANQRIAEVRNELIQLGVPASAIKTEVVSLTEEGATGRRVELRLNHVSSHK